MRTPLFLVRRPKIKYHARGPARRGVNGALANRANNEDNKLANLTAGRWQAVARAERKLETPAIIAASTGKRTVEKRRVGT